MYLSYFTSALMRTAFRLMHVGRVNNKSNYLLRTLRKCLSNLCLLNEFNLFFLMVKKII